MILKEIGKRISPILTCLPLAFLILFNNVIHTKNEISYDGENITYSIERPNNILGFSSTEYEITFNEKFQAISQNLKRHSLFKHDDYRDWVYKKLADDKVDEIYSSKGLINGERIYLKREEDYYFNTEIFKRADRELEEAREKFSPLIEKLYKKYEK